MGGSSGHLTTVVTESGRNNVDLGFTGDVQVDCTTVEMGSVVGEGRLDYAHFGRTVALDIDAYRSAATAVSTLRGQIVTVTDEG